MRLGYFQGLSLEDRIKVATATKGIPRLLVPVLPFCAYVIYGGAELLDERLDGL